WRPATVARGKCQIACCAQPQIRTWLARIRPAERDDETLVIDLGYGKDHPRCIGCAINAAYACSRAIDDLQRRAASRAHGALWPGRSPCRSLRTDGSLKPLWAHGSGVALQTL